MIAVSYIQPSVWHLSDPDPPSVLLSLPCPFSLALSWFWVLLSHIQQHSAFLRRTSFYNLTPVRKLPLAYPRITHSAAAPNTILCFLNSICWLLYIELQCPAWFCTWFCGRILSEPSHGCLGTFLDQRGRWAVVINKPLFHELPRRIFRETAVYLRQKLRTTPASLRAAGREAALPPPPHGHSRRAAARPSAALRGPAAGGAAPCAGPGGSGQPSGRAMHSLAQEIRSFSRANLRKQRTRVTTLTGRRVIETWRGACLQVEEEAEAVPGGGFVQDLSCDLQVGAARPWLLLGEWGGRRGISSRRRGARRATAFSLLRVAGCRSRSGDPQEA